MSTRVAFLRRIAALDAQRTLASTPRARGALLAVGLVLIVAQQAAHWAARDATPDRYKQRAASGMHDERRFVSFLVHAGQFPVTTELAEVPTSRAGIDELVRTRGDTLLMEYGHTIRGGDLGRTLLFLPTALLLGVERAALPPFHAVAFTLALCLLFVALWGVRQPVLAVALPLLIGGHPLQVYEVYARADVFGWPIIVAVLSLALNVPLFLSRSTVPRLVAYGAPLATGVLVACARELRTEAAIAATGALLVYLVALMREPRRGALQLALFALAFVPTSRACQSFFDSKWTDAQAYVRAAGGHVFEGPRTRHHAAWHPIWCGLGDYGHDKGYAWKDQAAHAYATPLLESKYGVVLPRLDDERDQVYKSAFWDEGKKYYKVTSEMPHYDDVLREKVVGDIQADPLWYAAIIARRVGASLAFTSPVQLAAGPLRVPVPSRVWSGALLLVLLLAAVTLRQRHVALLLLHTLPLAAAAILVFSGKGMTFYSVFPQVVVAVVLALAVEAVAAAREHAQKGRERRDG